MSNDNSRDALRDALLANEALRDALAALHDEVAALREGASRDEIAALRGGPLRDVVLASDDLRDALDALPY